MKEKKNLTINQKYDSLDYLEVEIVQDVYVPKKDDPEEYDLVKKGVTSRKTIWKTEVCSVEEMVNGKANIVSHKVKLGIKGEDAIIVMGNYKQFKQLIYGLPKTTGSLGFKFY